MKEPYNLDLHIGRLVLHGFDEVDPTALGATVERELARLLREPGVSGVLAQGRHLQHLKGEAFTARPNAAEGALGMQIAQSIYGGLTE